MDIETLRTDPIGTLLDMEGDSAQIIPDPVNGYDRVIPEPAILDDMAAMYATAIQSTDTDYENGIWKQQAEMEKVYEGISDAGETITLPVTKRIVNQQTAWVSTSILSKTPIITVKPIDGGSYTLPAEATNPSATPQVGASFNSQTLTAEEASYLYESFLQYKLTEKIDFEQLVEDTVTAIHIGEAPTWWKVYYNPQTRTAKRRKFTDVGGGKLVFHGLEDTKVAHGETVLIDHLSNRNVTMPLDETDEQQASWLAERGDLTNAQIWEGIKTGRYDFCQAPKDDGSASVVDPAEVKALLGLSSNPQESSYEQQFAEIDRRVAAQPQLKHDVRTVWFFYPVKRTVKIQTDGPPNADGSPASMDEQRIEMRSMCGTLHVKGKKFLNLYCNPYWHGKRPYVPFFMRKRPHRFSGTTSVGDIAPLQRLISSIFHLEIQNGVQQNVKVFLLRNNSVTWRFFKQQGNVLKPGMKIPFDDEKDVLPIQLGSPVQSMAAEVSFLSGEADRLAVERDYTDIPGRTPAATFAQFEQLAKMQPQTILRGVRRRISKAIEMYLQTVTQYHIYETIPFLDPKQNKLVQKLISFPQDAIENHFSFHVTATGDEDSSEAKIQKTTILLQQTQQVNAESTEHMNIALDPRVPKPQRDYAQFIAVRSETLYGDLIKASRQDWKKFVLTDEKINAMRQEADAIYQQAEEEAAKNPPPPPEPNVNISIKGEMAPLQAQEVVEQMTGAKNASQPVSPAGPGGAVPQSPAGQPGSGIVPQQPSDQGAGQPPAPGDLLAGNPAGPVQ